MKHNVPRVQLIDRRTCWRRRRRRFDCLEEEESRHTELRSSSTLSRVLPLMS